MSSFSDTPECLARSEANEALREMPYVAADALADAVQRTVANHDGDPERVELIAADLRCRADTGTRFCLQPQPIESETSNGAPEPAATDIDIAELIDDEIPW